MNKKITEDEIENLKKIRELNEEVYQNMVEIGKTITVFTTSTAWIQLKCQIGGAKAILELIFEKLKGE